MQPDKLSMLSAEETRPTRVEIDLTALSENLAAIRKKVSPAKVMIIVKANAYGHGMVRVARHLAPKADYLGVAVLEEGLLLRAAGIRKPILVLGGILEAQISEFIRNDLTITASSVENLQQIERTAARLKRKATVHLKIDTGMERIGVHYYDAQLLQKTALQCKHVNVEGIYSHFANADARDLQHARLQLARFNDVLKFYEKHALPMPRFRHIANSGAILQLPEATFNMVRPGIMLYGVYPSAAAKRTVKIKPALSWYSKVVYFKEIRPAHPVSYGSTWQSSVPTRVATLPVGYGDGYFRAMSNKAEVILRGVRVPQVGRICMDQTIVNLGAEGVAALGDDVVLLGEQGGRRVTAEELAHWAGTIPYEVLTNINARVPRIYKTRADESLG
jgi:alanine racemase